MNPREKSACPQCGAISADGKTCKDKYGEILALEFEDPAVFGAVHHITVACYNLQHPDYFSDEAREWMRTALHRVVEEGLPPADMLKNVRKRAGEGMKVRRRTAPESPPGRIAWSMTVMAVRTDSAEVYIEDIKAWAKSILSDLDRQ